MSLPSLPWLASRWTGPKSQPPPASCSTKQSQPRVNSPQLKGFHEGYIDRQWRSEPYADDRHISFSVPCGSERTLLKCSCREVSAPSDPEPIALASHCQNVPDGSVWYLKTQWHIHMLCPRNCKHSRCEHHTPKTPSRHQEDLLQAWSSLIMSSN